MTDQELRKIILPIMRDFNHGRITDIEFCEKIDAVELSDADLDRARVLLYG